MKYGKLLKERLEKQEILVVPGAYDCLSAKIIETIGFDVVYLTGYGSTASILGSPDVGLLTFSEMAKRAADMVDAVGIPVIADADTGYGNAVNVIRTTKVYEKAGIACMQIEDQLSPKKCGHMLGREIISTEEMIGKIKAAVDARNSLENMLIMARTDARTNFGIEAAIERGKAFEEAGADILFIESPESIEEMKLITSSFNTPVLANMIEHGRTPFLNVQTLQELGYDLAIFPVSTIYTAAKAVSDMLLELKTKGSTDGFINKMIPFEEFNHLVGLPEIQHIEKKYNTGRDFSK